MSNREYRQPRPEAGDRVGYINGWPDSRGLPTIRVVCEGRRDKSTGHAETVLATFQCFPFDPSKGECGNWFWDEGVATGGGARHSTTRLREDKSKRKVTPEEEERGWRPGFVEVGPKHHVTGPEMAGTSHFKCPRCPSELYLRGATLQEILDRVLLTSPDGLPVDMAVLAELGARKISLPALIKIQTTKGR